MSTIDPSKLKVVDLRAQLTSRGLDTKGVKVVLVKRLKEALEKELNEEIADTSIADTSTEETNTTQEITDDDVPIEVIKKKDVEEKPKSEPPPKEQKVVEEPKVVEKDSLPNESVATTGESKVVENVVEQKEKLVEHQESQIEDVKEPSIVVEEPDKTEDEPSKPDEESSADVVMRETPVEENGEKMEDEIQEVKSDEPETKSEHKGEKRRRSSPSPERVSRRRSKTPIKEDEPVLDNDKVQLSWYDSDLHLSVDKKSFLSGKPYHEGAFGYAWAGVRATHGVKSGKVCYEVKITEELKWEDVAKHSDRKRDSHRSDRRRSERSSYRNEEGARSDEGSDRGKMEDKEKSEDSNDKEKATTTDDENKEKSGDDSGDKEMKEDEDSSKKEKNEESQEENKEKAADLKMEEEEETKIDKDKKDMESTVKTNEPLQGEETPVDENPDELTKTDVKTTNEDNEEKEIETKEETETETKEEKEVETKEEITEKEEAMEVEEIPTEPIAKHLFRFGWSLINTNLQLGEDANSFGYESSGKFVASREFTNYGIKFGVGDVVTAYLNIDEEFVSFTFAVNGELQPEAASIPRSDFPEDNFALFPHILTRNYAFELNLGGQEEPWFPAPTEFADYAFIQGLEDKVSGPLRPESRSECEVIMMCGLPGSGKTHWVREMVSTNADKRYTVIGNTHLLEKMTVNGNPLRNSYKGRWGVILDRLLKCVNTLVELASVRRRNYVIDQTNVFPSAQRRKMRLFEGFKRRAVVVVVGDEEQAKRRAQQEAQDGKDVPDSAILEMKANMSLPRRGEWLEEVSYCELNEDDAKALVQKYNQQGRDAGFGPLNQRSSYRDNRGHPYRWDHSTSRRDYRGGYRENRSYQSNRYDRPRQQGWQNRRPPPGSWNRDVRRDSRGPPGGGSRDYRNNNRSPGTGGRAVERSSSRDNRNRTQNTGNYNRNPRPQSNRNQAPHWQGGSGGGGAWQNQSWGGQGMWNQGGWAQGGWSGQAQQWKAGYGQGGYSQGGYGNYPNWNYYGQYAQNWNSQGQPQTTAAGGTSSGSAGGAYAQYSNQEAWAQYAQQYAQQGQTPSTATQESIQK